MRRGRVSVEEARQHEARAWELRMIGYTHDRIAEELNMKRSSVTKILARVRKRVQSKLDSDVEQHHSEQIARLNRIYYEAMHAWENSKQTSKTVSKRRTGAGTVPVEGEIGVGQEEVTIKLQDEDGDPRYLNAAMAALSDLRKIQGLDMPIKVSQVIDTKDANAMSQDERAKRIQELLEKAQSRKKEPDLVQDDAALMLPPDQKAEIVQ